MLTTRFLLTTGIFLIAASMHAAEPPVKSGKDLLALIEKLEARLDGKHLEAQYTFTTTPNLENMRMVRLCMYLQNSPEADPGIRDFHDSFERQYGGNPGEPDAKVTVDLLCDMTQYRCWTDTYSEEFDGQYLWSTHKGEKPTLRRLTHRPFPMPQKLFFSTATRISEWGNFQRTSEWDTLSTPIVRFIESGIKEDIPLKVTASPTRKDCWVVSWTFHTLGFEVEIDGQAGNAIRRYKIFDYHDGIPSHLGETVETTFDDFEELAPGLFFPKKITAEGRSSLAYWFTPEELKFLRDKIPTLGDPNTSLITRTHRIEFQKLKLVNKELVLDAGAFGE